MGSDQGKTHQPTQTVMPETTQRKSNEPDICSLCLSKNQRVRQSVCICSHCSLPLCSDCIHNHIDDLPKNIAQLSHQLHELQQLFQEKKTMVQQESSKSTGEIIEFVKTHHNNLVEALHTNISGVENAKKDAEKYLNNIHSELQTIRNDIETLSGEPIFQPTRMEALVTQLNQIQEKLETYNITEDIELQSVMLKYIIKFERIPTTTTDESELPESEPSNSKDNSRKKSSRQNKFHPYKKDTKQRYNGETKHS